MTDLTPEFRHGLDAKPGERCPYLATSSSADAWWLGRFARELRFNAEMQCGKVTRGRGDRLNLLVGRHGKTVIRVDWNTGHDNPAVTYA